MILLQTTDDVFVYNATDVLVQSTWELPIVIQWPQSHVTFEFTSQPGEISFGIMFVAAPESDDHGKFGNSYCVAKIIVVLYNWFLYL